MTHHHRALQFWQHIADTSTDPDTVGEALDHVAIHRDATADAEGARDMASTADGSYAANEGADGGGTMNPHIRALQFWQNIADTSTDPDTVGEALDHVAIHRDAIKRGGWW